jgi:3-dehydroquinate synthase
LITVLEHYGLAAISLALLMKKLSYSFSNSATGFYLASGMSHLKEIVDPGNAILITDENIYEHHLKRFKNWNVIVLRPGEQYKTQATVDSLIDQMIAMGADRSTTLVGVGGGVVTDLTGYAASVYMRGIKFGFVPTTLLSMVDASIGGKNGIDVGVYKNLVGTIRQPAFILHDLVFLNSLPEAEWINGFAEIIKHACIRDAAMFRELEANSLKKFQGVKTLVCRLIQKNAILKTKIVQRDEFEQGERKLLNFGHTLGHALENQYELSHGQAISIGMTYACQFSEQLVGFRQRDRVVALLEKYGLPTYAAFDKQRVFDVLKMDKKRTKKTISYVLLNKIGSAVTQSIPITEMEKIIFAL